MSNNNDSFGVVISTPNTTFTRKRKQKLNETMFNEIE